MQKIVISIAVNAFALWVAASLVSGVELSSSLGAIIFVAAIFGLVNALLKPIAVFLSLPALVLTLGLFLLVVNAAMLGITSKITSHLTVDGFWPAVGGALVISLVSWVLSIAIPEEDKRKRQV